MQVKYLDSVIKQFKYYKYLGDKTLELLEGKDLYFQPNSESNSIEIIIKHLSGNMISRWTDFLTTDGEKESRNRDFEFESSNFSKEQLISIWEKGWNHLFIALESLEKCDLEDIIYIRNIGHPIFEAINRQLAHYAYHTGQIVYIGKIIKADSWSSLSIPKNKSREYNLRKFQNDKTIKHFTDDLLNEF